MAATPPFFFQINRIEEDPDIPIRRMGHISWAPPRRKYGSRTRGTPGTVYYFNGTRAVAAETIPSGIVHYRSVSLYHHGDLFWTIPFDATEHQVGNGQQTDVEPDDDSDPDAEGESDDDESDEILQDWGLLYFMWNENDAVSQCVFQGNQQRLIYQRPDQGWVNDILSRRHHATHDRITTDIRYGGLIGDLGIIIGLIALSVRHGRVDETVQHCLRAVGGDTGGWRRPRRTDVPSDRRGVLVRIWCWPPYSTADALTALENGCYGKIYH